VTHANHTANHTAADLTAAIASRLAAIACQAQTAAEAIDGNALDLPEGTLAGIAAELGTLAGRLDLALDRLADSLDPAPQGR
jgi:hypothetical protein